MFDFKKLEGFDWDKGNLEHVRRHGVNYKECEQVFFNKPFLVNEDNAHSQIEERFEVLGRTRNERLLFVVFTFRGKTIRVVTARDQSKKERKQFSQPGGEIYEKT